MLEIIFDLPFGFPINNIISLWKCKLSLSTLPLKLLAKSAIFRSDLEKMQRQLLNSLREDTFGLRKKAHIARVRVSHDGAEWTVDVVAVTRTFRQIQYCRNEGVQENNKKMTTLILKMKL